MMTGHGQALAKRQGLFSSRLPFEAEHGACAGIGDEIVMNGFAVDGFRQSPAVNPLPQRTVHPIFGLEVDPRPVDAEIPLDVRFDGGKHPFRGRRAEVQAFF